ncbi:hypothetical protein SPI_00116 [Niveomyces insectorum RCEF 264]|uniref:F-box domain-containing protein n=1 Tax=Niveomyces insectorum RCEF 264 TaxID=1081102 RepID=A0A167ZUI8_9HYPO|nr:hypothetical protein SPI_00116 [Niveomyces insectorum RCEF 264]
MHPQDASLLMQLPQELRDEIYAHVFFSTRLASGARSTARFGGDQEVRSAPHALALLRTCRRVHAEIGTRWLHMVLFSFETPKALLDKLTNVSIATRSLIRHVRVSGLPLVLSLEEDDLYYRTLAVDKLLPGLQLDRLTVLGTRSDKISYETLTNLIRDSDGWKELYYVTHNSAFLGYKDNWGGFDESEPDPYLRVPQPAGWQAILDARDGAASQPSVTIYRATDPDRPCSVLHAHLQAREPFVQRLAAGQTLATFGTTEDAVLMQTGQREREMLVVAKRGQGVDYQEKENSPFLDDDIRKEMSGMTWKQFQAMYAGDDEDWPSRDGEDGQSKKPLLVDAYKHVDDYVWPPDYFINE